MLIRRWLIAEINSLRRGISLKLEASLVEVFHVLGFLFALFFLTHNKVSQKGRNKKHIKFVLVICRI